MKTHLKTLIAIICGLSICVVAFNLVNNNSTPKVIPPKVLQDNLTNSQIFCMMGSYNLRDESWHDDVILSPKNYQFVEKDEFIRYLRTAKSSSILNADEQTTLRNDIIKLAKYAGRQVTTKNKDDHEVTDYFYLYANAGQLYQVTFKDGCIFKAVQTTEKGYISFEIAPDLMLSHEWKASPKLLHKLNN